MAWGMQSVMTMVNYYKILDVTKSADDAEIKTAYRALARKLHPDVNPGNKAAEDKFKRVTAAYEVLIDPKKRARYDVSGSADPIRIASKRNIYELDDIMMAGDVADIYRFGRDAIKIGRSATDNDLLDNEARVLKSLFPKDEAATKRRYFPELVESFKINSGEVRSVNVTRWLDAVPLSHIRTVYPKGVRFEHAVWMLNRMLEGLEYLHVRAKTVHGAITPAHVMIYPKDHGAAFVGFGAATPIGETVKVISSAWAPLYAPEIAAKQPVGPSTDIYMAVKCAMYALGADMKTGQLPSTVPPYLARFLSGCTFQNPRTRPQDAWALHEELKELMEQNYGPRKFIPFEVPNV